MCDGNVNIQQGVVREMNLYFYFSLDLRIGCVDEDSLHLIFLFLHLQCLRCVDALKSLQLLPLCTAFVIVFVVARYFLIVDIY